MDWANVHLLWRERCFGGMEEAARRAGVGDMRLGIAQGLAIVLSDQIPLGLKALKSLEQQSPLAIAIAMHYAHNQCEVVDKDAVTLLEGKIRDIKRRPEPKDMYNTALVYYLTGNPTKANEFLQSYLISEPDSSDGIALVGWLNLKTDRKAAGRYFSSAIQKERENIDALFGELTVVNLSEGISKINHVVVRHPKSTAALLMKMRLLLASKEWDQVFDTVNRILLLQPSNIFALHMKALRYVAGGKFKESLEILDKLRDEINKQEEKAWWLFIELSGCIARCCSREPKILASCIQMVRCAVSAAPFILDPLLELAYQQLLSGDIQAANTTYTSASKLDGSSLEPLIGLTAIQLAQTGKSKQIRQQVEFLKEVKVGGEVLLMEAKMSDDSIDLLDEAVTHQKSKASAFPFGVQHLITFDPDLVLRIAQEYPNTENGEKRRAAVSKLLVETIPGMIEAYLLLAKAHIILNEAKPAQKVLQNVIDHLDQSNPQAHLLMAQIQIDQGDYEGGKGSLDLGLSYNLNVVELPRYHLLNGLIHRKYGDLASSISSFQQALKTNTLGGESLSLNDLGLLYRELCETLLEQGSLDEGWAMLEEAEKEIQGCQQHTSELTLVRARLAILRNDVNLAFAILDRIAPSQPHYTKAQTLKADICLNHMKDPIAYTECFTKLVELNPSTENYLLLGDAYLKIQEPEMAVESYEKALRGGTIDPKLSCKLARVLVKCHQYAKAIKCYRDSGEQGSMELAELLLKLGQTDKAEATLSNVKNSLEKALILAKVYEKGGTIEKALQTLQAVESEQWKEKPDLGAKLNEQMGLYATMLREFDTAIESYRRALNLKPNSPNVQITLAKLYLQVNDWSACESVCSSLLEKEPENEPALLMVADLAFRRVEFDKAHRHFAALLEAQPTSWVALARIIEILRRTAQLPQAKHYIEEAKALAPNHPGLAYCTGLYYWYSNNVTLAIENFNKARGDGEWGAQAVHNMIEACMGQRGASERLLAEMKPHTPDEEARLQLLTAFVSLATDNKEDVEAAINIFTQLINTDSHKVGATLGLGMSYVAQKQVTRARSVLKRVGKSSWQLEEADHLEKSWLLLAELYLQSGKQEISLELLLRVIQHNQSSAKAYELIALISEKEQKYYNASQNYQQAWKLGGESDPGLGYRLAYNLVKAKRYAEAISVCQTVLKLKPDYPRIKKDVYDKALSHLRT